MKIQVRRAEYEDVEALRGLYRREANCQIIHDSALARGLADPHLIMVDGRIGGYGGIWNKYHPGRLMEFHALPHVRGLALPMVRELIAAGGATHVEAQTNMPTMLMILYDCARGIATESILFRDTFATDLPRPLGEFRRSRPEDADLMPGGRRDDLGDWLIEDDGRIAATGGFLCHYNPPFGDIYMEVMEPYRRRGLGSYLVQEVKRTCYEAGKEPAARCNPGNIASRQTLQKAGLLPCGRLLAGEVAATDDPDAGA